jgi:hypothetical protein
MLYFGLIIILSLFVIITLWARHMKRTTSQTPMSCSVIVHADDWEYRPIHGGDEFILVNKHTGQVLH